MKIISLDKGCFAFILGLLLWCSHMHANSLESYNPLLNWQSSVSGTVSDGTGPLPGVTIYVKGSSTSTVSGDDGNFTIAAAVGDTLVFSFLGFKDIELAVTSLRHNVILQEDVSQLQEVVINAGYYSVKDRNRTGSISRITAKDIETQPVTNVLATMQGRMAGVSITQNTGVPGGGFDIQVRGQNSLRADGNSPLFIIDGVPYATQTVGYGASTVVMPFTSSPLNSINPGDIESIEVLKDADATAIYGSRGANGVVLVTTKKGKEGKTRFNVGYSGGIGKVTGFMDLMDTRQYLAMRAEAFENDGIPYGPADYDINGTWDQSRYTDWQKELLGGTAVYQDAQASVSGGLAQTQFLVGSNWHTETTVFPGDYRYNKSNLRANINHESQDRRFRINLTAGYTIQKNDLPGNDLTRRAITLAPNAPALYDGQGNLNWENSTWQNPLAALNAEYLANTSDLIGNMVVSYNLTEDLAIKASSGFTDTRHKETRTEPSTIYDPAYGVGSESSSAVFNNTDRQSWILEPQVTWHRTIGPGKLEALAGATWQEVKSNQFVQFAFGFPSNALINHFPAAGYVGILADERTEYRYHAFFGRINYGIKDKYFINLTGRRDGSSRFGPGRQFASFGAIGAAWIISNEELIKDSKIVSFLKLRGSYGTSGNDQIGDYQFMDAYSTAGSNYGGVVGIAPVRLFNPDFGWETNRKLELAVEAGFFRDRIYITAGWYRNRSSSQLVGIPLPATTGFPSVQANLDATVQNSGMEFTLRSTNLDSKHFSWTTNFNIAVSKNKLIEFPGLEGSTYSNQYVIGSPLNITKLYGYSGVDPQTGVYTFVDVNGDGQITTPEDRQTVVDFNPQFFGGLQNQLSYKQWQLSFLFQFVKQLNYSPEYSTGRPGAMGNQPPAVMDRWQQPGDIASHQQYTTGANPLAADAGGKYFESNAIVTDASFIRLKNIALSYTLPDNLIKSVQCRLTFEAQNLLTITPYKGADPEFRFAGYLPPLRTITTGLQLNF